MFGLFKKKQAVVEQPDEASTVVPRIKHTNFLTTLRAVIKKEDDMPVTEPLVGDLLVTYAFDLPEAFKMFCGRDLKRLGWSLDDLRATAMANLQVQLGEIGCLGVPPLMQVAAGNDLEACVLLADDFWLGQAEQIPGEILVGVPTRNTLFFISAETGEAGFEHLRNSIKAARTGNNTHWLTERILVRREGKWEVFDA